MRVLFDFQKSKNINAHVYLDSRTKCLLYLVGIMWLDGKPEANMATLYRLKLFLFFFFNFYNWYTRHEANTII